MDAATLLIRAAARHAERPFVIDDAGPVTFAEALHRARAIAGGLISRGVTPGDAVGLCSPDSTPLIVNILATWLAGAIPAPVDPRTRDANLPYFLGDIAPVLIVSTDEHAERLAGRTDAPVIGFDALVSAWDGSAPNRHGPASPLFWSYTSGSTGAPKACVLESGPVTLGTACIAERLGLGATDVIIATTPTPSSFQLVSSLLPALHRGAAVRLVSGRDADGIWDAATERGGTVLVAYPLTLGDVVRSQRASSDHSFRVALSGGSPLAPRLKRAYADRLGIPLIESYGQSEFGGFMAMGELAGGDRALAGYVGRPLPDRLAYVGGPDGAELPAGTVGEVLVPEGFFPGYRNKPVETEKTLAGGVLHCGDLAISDEEGYLKVLGRVQERDRAGARGAFLRELEDRAYEHPDVKHAAVVERADSGAVRAYAELLDGRQAPAQALREFILAGVSSDGLDVEGLDVRMLEMMPRTFSGKADRHGLSNLLA
ncbi:MAG: acyl--CoA ligase [Actinomycetota bacterium]|nr:acyl--CoA ligase [Actinomycetota bacterium]